MVVVMMRCWPWLAGRCGEWWRVPVSTPPQPRPAHLRSAEAGPRTGSWSVEADGACPASTASQWPGDGSGYQHTWTCTCARSAPGPQPSPPSSYPPRPHPGSGSQSWDDALLLPPSCHFTPVSLVISGMEDRGCGLGEISASTGPGPAPASWHRLPVPLEAGLTHSDSCTALSLSSQGCGNH